MRHALTQPKLVIPILCLQFVPLVLFPPTVFVASSQEWWLPLLLTVAALWALITLVVRHSQESWPWFLMAFGQGFNIISRLMTILPHAFVPRNGQQVFDVLYVSFAVTSMLLSVFMLWYMEMAEVRIAVTRR